MKIILCTHKYVYPFVGGVDVYTHRLGEALIRLGHDVKIFAFDPTSESAGENILISEEVFKGTEVWRFKFLFSKRPQSAHDYAYDPEVRERLKQILQEQKPDLFIIMNFYMITLSAVEAAKDLDIPVIHIATDFIPICRRATLIRWDGKSCTTGESVKSCTQCFVSHHAFGRLASAIFYKLPDRMLPRISNNENLFNPPNPLWLLNPFLKQAVIMEKRLSILQPLREKIDLVLAPTRYTSKMFAENGFKSDQMHFLPFGVDEDNPLSRLEKLPSAHVRFLFIGRFQPYKGAHILVEAFNNLASPKESTLTIYGTADDGYIEYFNKLNSMMKSNSRIRNAGQISPNRLNNAFREGDIFVLPSTWHENSPLILLDAIQSKTPVVASDIGGVTDIVKDGINGLLFPMGNPQALQQVMQKIINKPKIISQLKAGAKLLSIDEYARTMIQLCQEKRIF